MGRGSMVGKSHCHLALTHWGRDKFAAFSQTTYSKASTFLNENVWISINISLKCVPKGQINNIPALLRHESCPNDNWSGKYRQDDISLSVTQRVVKIIITAVDDGYVSYLR